MQTRWSKYQALPMHFPDGEIEQELILGKRRYEVLSIALAMATT